jgi:hypothetical protein
MQSSSCRVFHHFTTSARCFLQAKQKHIQQLLQRPSPSSAYLVRNKVCCVDGKVQFRSISVIHVGGKKERNYSIKNTLCMCSIKTHQCHTHAICITVQYFYLFVKLFLVLLLIFLSFCTLPFVFVIILRRRISY